MTTARDRLIAYAASTRTITADGLDPLIDDVIAEALTPGTPLDLPKPALEALSLVGNKALGDHYHEDLCNCDHWPDSCTSYKAGWWDTSAFAIALPAILGAWQEMQAAGVQTETPACGERLGDAVCVSREPDHWRHITADGDYWIGQPECPHDDCEQCEDEEPSLHCGATAADGTACGYIAQHRRYSQPHTFETTPTA